MFLGTINTTKMSNIDWTALNAKLPTGKSPESKAARKKMFHDFDPNGNGILSLSEVDKGCRDVLGLHAVFDAKPAIMRAFQIAKGSKASKRGKTGDDYIELREFKFFLLSLRQYFEYFEAFSRVDTSNDNRISLEEFKQNQAKIEAWVGKIDAEEEFKKVDTNGGGFILFDEFVKWAITKNLDLEDDDDDIDQ